MNHTENDLQAVWQKHSDMPTPAPTPEVEGSHSDAFTALIEHRKAFQRAIAVDLKPGQVLVPVSLKANQLGQGPILIDLTLLPPLAVKALLTHEGHLKDFPDMFRDLAAAHEALNAVVATCTKARSTVFNVTEALQPSTPGLAEIFDEIFGKGGAT